MALDPVAQTSQLFRQASKLVTLHDMLNLQPMITYDRHFKNYL